MEFKKLEDSEAELFLRTKNEILKIELPSKFVEKLKSLKDDMRAHDLLEVLIKSTQNMVQMMHNLKEGDYQYEDPEGENCKIKKTSKC